MCGTALCLCLMSTAVRYRHPKTYVRSSQCIVGPEGCGCILTDGFFVLVFAYCISALHILLAYWWLRRWYDMISALVLFVWVWVCLGLGVCVCEVHKESSVTSLEITGSICTAAVLFHLILWEFYTFIRHHGQVHIHICVPKVQSTARE